MADVEEPQYEEEVAEEVEAEEEEEEEYAYADDAPEVKLFGKWSFDDVEVRDISLVVSLPLGKTRESRWTELVTTAMCGEYASWCGGCGAVDWM